MSLMMLSHFASLSVGSARPHSTRLPAVGILRSRYRPQPAASAIPARWSNRASRLCAQAHPGYLFRLSSNKPHLPGPFFIGVQPYQRLQLRQSGARAPGRKLTNSQRSAAARVRFRNATGTARSSYRASLPVRASRAAAQRRCGSGHPRRCSSQEPTNGTSSTTGSVEVLRAGICSSASRGLVLRREQANPSELRVVEHRVAIARRSGAHPEQRSDIQPERILLEPDRKRRTDRNPAQAR